MPKGLLTSILRSYSPRYKYLCDVVIFHEFNKMSLFQLLITINNGQPHHQDNMQADDDAVCRCEFFDSKIFRFQFFF